MEEEKKKCFVIMPISDTDGYEKGHFTRVYEHLIKPAVTEAGFVPVRADDTSKANFIVIDILQQILDCEIAICDLSSRNPNVFYELGIRQAFNKRTVLISDKNTIKPFDTSGIRTLDYYSTLRIDEVKKSIPEIAKCIKTTYEADANEVNSLLQLLSVEKPAILPEKITLSQDSSMILNAIKQINNKIDRLSGSQEDSYVTLPNKEVLSIGGLVANLEDNQLVGKLIGVYDNTLIIKSDNQFKFIPIDSEDAKFFWESPF